MKKTVLLQISLLTLVRELILVTLFIIRVHVIFCMNNLQILERMVALAHRILKQLMTSMMQKVQMNLKFLQVKHGLLMK
jgi:hypothetical protein